MHGLRYADSDEQGINFSSLLLCRRLRSCYIIAGFLILLGGANPGWSRTGKTMFTNTTWGLIIIFTAWMITNSVLKSIAGNSPFTKDWNKVVCIQPAPQPPPSTQKYNCSSLNVCMPTAGGQYTEPTCGGQCTPAQPQKYGCDLTINALPILTVNTLNRLVIIYVLARIC